MALSRFFAAVVACVIVASTPVLANEVQEINQQFRKGDLTGALDRANRYLAKNPKDAQARFLKGLILADQGKTNDAITVFTGLTEDYPELPEPYNNLAVLYASQSKYEAAKNALEMAIRTHPSYATAHENLGDIYAKMASLAYDKALALDSKNATAQTKLALIQDMIGGQPRKPAAARPAAGCRQTGRQPRRQAGCRGACTRPSPPRQAMDVEAAITRWAQAWSARDVDAYLAAYASDFTADGMTRANWEAQRRARITAPKTHRRADQRPQDRAAGRHRQRHLPSGLPFRPPELHRHQDAETGVAERTVAHRRRDIQINHAASSCSRFCLPAPALHAAGLDADRQLANSLLAISQSRMPEALTAVDQLTQQHPNFRLAHLVKGDLLLARAQPLQTLGNTGGARSADLDQLRDEARQRVRAAHRFAAQRQGPGLPAEPGRQLSPCAGGRRQPLTPVRLCQPRRAAHPGGRLLRHHRQGRRRQAEGRRQPHPDRHLRDFQLQVAARTHRLLRQRRIHPVLSQRMGHPPGPQRSRHLDPRQPQQHLQPRSARQRRLRGAGQRRPDPAGPIHPDRQNAGDHRRTGRMGAHEALDARRNDLAAAIDQWRQDWESRDTARLLSHYSASFRTGVAEPADLWRQQTESQRRQVVDQGRTQQASA